MRERSLLPPVLGIPPLAAAGLAVGATALGVLVDLLRIGTVGRVFEVCYLLGCVLAVSWVRRRGLFLPAVQPPLLLAVVVPLVAMLIGAPSGGGAAQSLLMAGAPLINAFPAMAVTTLVVLLLAGLRALRQRLGPDDAVGRLRHRVGRDPGGHDPDGPGARTRPPRGGATGTAARSRTSGGARTGSATGSVPDGRTGSSGRTGSAGRTGSTSTGVPRSGSAARSTGSASRSTGSVSRSTGSAARSARSGSGSGGSSRSESSRGSARGATGRTRRDTR
ncbi:DUF6542 domain-containing protein [Pseudonocardia sp. ICBG1293]|uniref:DUF6542 domain-containing protein n=1 Tax=Pseudonocardia sp. ICBG1293 TaxID=2844382 RepID=UPI001CCA29BF|nr:DUF6542 domain-containing protein [Pseudonocardia sp. ICBG1293]